MVDEVRLHRLMRQATDVVDFLDSEAVAVRDELVVANLSRTGDIRAFVSAIATWLA